MSAQVARLFFTVDRLSDGCDRVFLLYNAASSPNPTSSRTLLSPHPVTPPPPLCRLLPNHCLHRLLPTWPRPLASAASSPTCAITSSPLPARVMRSGSHDALRSGHNGPRSGHHGFRSMVARPRTQCASPSGVDLGHRGGGEPPGGAVRRVRGDAAHPACFGADVFTLRREAAVRVHARCAAGLGCCGCRSVAPSSPSLPVCASQGTRILDPPLMRVV
jgi:hypothetical protein